MTPAVEKFLEFLSKLDADRKVIDFDIDFPKSGDADQIGFLGVEITLNAEMMDKLIASGLIKKTGGDQWGDKYEIVE